MGLHRLTLLPGELAVCRLPAGAPAPPVAAHTSSLSCVVRTPHEVSVVCEPGAAPPGARVETGWRALRVEGPFDLTAVTGVLAALTAPLAAAGISLFAIATFDTDYLLVQASALEAAAAALRNAGHTVDLDAPAEV